VLERERVAGSARVPKKKLRSIAKMSFLNFQRRRSRSAQRDAGSTDPLLQRRLTFRLHLLNRRKKLAGILGAEFLEIRQQMSLWTRNGTFKRIKVFLSGHGKLAESGLITGSVFDVDEMLVVGVCFVRRKLEEANGSVQHRAELRKVFSGGTHGRRFA